MKKITFLIIITLICHGVFSQTKLSLLNGKQLNVKEYSFYNNNDIDFLEYKIEKKNGKLKSKYSNLDEVWSFNDSVIYNPSENGEFAVSDMKNVVLGKQIAETEFHAWWAFASGFAVGASSVLYFSTNGRPMLGLALPIVYAAGISFTRPTKHGISKRHPEYTDNEYFLYGYQNKGKRKIFNNTIFGTLSGLAASAITMGIIRNAQL